MPQNHRLWEEYILNTGNKIAFFRKFKKMSLETLATKTKIPLQNLGDDGELIFGADNTGDF